MTQQRRGEHLRRAELLWHGFRPELKRPRSLHSPNDTAPYGGVRGVSAVVVAHLDDPQLGHLDSVQDPVGVVADARVESRLVRLAAPVE